LDNARLDARSDNGGGEEKIEISSVRNGRPAPAGGVDVAAIRRELKAVLEQLRG
jgi:hypothetical protein